MVALMQKHFLTYGDGIFSKRKDILKDEIIRSELFHWVYSFGRENIWDFYLEHKNLMDNFRGSGCWIWKPYIIYTMLLQIPDNDILYYCDAGCYLINIGQYKKQREDRFDSYITILDSVDIPVTAFSPWTYSATQPDYTQINSHTQSALEVYGLLDSKEFLNYPGVESGFIICKKTEASVKFVKEWLDLMLKDNYDLILNHNATEQSILNMLFYKYNLTRIDGADFYGASPFFAGRLTDNGPKPGYNSPII